MPRECGSGGRSKNQIICQLYVQMFILIAPLLGEILDAGK